MNLSNIAKVQKVLDERIAEEHQLHEKYSKEKLIENKILALLVEVGELANETRCFKFWSVKPPSPKEVILEEYVDGLHFIVSLGNDLGFEYKDIDTSLLFEIQITARFSALYSYINHFKISKDKDSFHGMIIVFLILGKALGFSDKEIELAYMEKNKKNHVRQDTGY